VRSRRGATFKGGNPSFDRQVQASCMSLSVYMHV
jgi:hypothetical protein